MSYRTLEVELENGRIHPRGAEPLPAKARALLTILEPPVSEYGGAPPSSEAGLGRFLSRPPLNLTDEQFRTSMEADSWDQ
jgi:hypothetical protein